MEKYNLRTIKYAIKFSAKLARKYANAIQDRAIS